MEGLSFKIPEFADMAELADAYGSGPYGGNFVEVQVLLSAPYYLYEKDIEQKKPDKIGLFCTQNACKLLYKSIDVKWVFLPFDRT